MLVIHFNAIKYPSFCSVVCRVKQPYISHHRKQTNTEVLVKLFIMLCKCTFLLLLVALVFFFCYLLKCQSMSPVEVTRYHRLLNFPNPSHGHGHGCHSITGANDCWEGKDNKVKDFQFFGFQMKGERKGSVIFILWWLPDKILVQDKRILCRI